MERIEKLEKILQELGELGNSYAGDETGTEASLLHLASGNILRTINSLKGISPIDQHEVVRTYMRWSSDITLMESLGR